MGSVITTKNANKILEVLVEAGIEKEIRTSDLRKVVARVLNTPQVSTVTLMIKGMTEMGYLEKSGVNKFTIHPENKGDVLK